jgi:hypothetical protein
MRLAESLSLAMRALPGVEQGRSRFGKAGQVAWSVNGREFAHLHADDLLNLRLPRARQSQLREDPRAHFRSSRSEWLEFEFHSEQDIAELVVLASEAWAAAKEHKK